MNKRIRKKHIWIGPKKAGLIYCRCEIGNSIVRRCKEAGIKYNRQAIWSYTHWLSIHSSEDEWIDRVNESYYPHQMFLSAKHLIPHAFISKIKGEETTCSEA